MLGIDPVEDSVNTAQVHTSHDPDLRARVRYQACTLEELLAEEEAEVGRFDAVVASEVVEHLADLETFAFCCSHMLKVRPGIIHDDLMFMFYRIILASCGSVEQRAKDVHLMPVRCTHPISLLLS